MKNIKEELEFIEKVLSGEKNLDRITFYEGYIKGLKFGIEAIAARDEEWIGELKPCMNYCKSHNGLPYCKNCGLNLDDLIKTFYEKS